MYGLKQEKKKKGNYEVYKKAEGACLPPSYSSLFRSRAFFCNHPISDGEKILSLLNGILLEKKIVPESFLESVYKREELSSTAFYGQFAIAHEKAAAKKAAAVFCPVQFIRKFTILLTPGSGHPHRQSALRRDGISGWKPAREALPVHGSARAESGPWPCRWPRSEHAWRT